MPGFRQGPGNRPAWAHPQDLVNLLLELKSAFPQVNEEPFRIFGVFDEENFEDIIDLAWTHDLIEDGKKEDGSLVAWGDLVDAGIKLWVADSVSSLSHRQDESKEEYLAGLAKVLGPRSAIVKLVDRICNLREGSTTFKDKRWARYVDETEKYIVPLLNLIPNPSRDWLKAKLLEAMALRPAVR